MRRVALAARSRAALRPTTAAGAGSNPAAPIREASSALEAGSVDDVLVHVTPVLLGDGVRLFDRPGREPIRLTRTAVQETGELSALRFSVVRTGSR